MWWMAIPALLQAGGQMFGGMSAIKMSGYSADIAKYAAGYREAAREVEETRLKMNKDRLMSAQKAAAAASGIRTDVGAPMDLAAETEVLYDIDRKLLRSAGSIESLRSQIERHSLLAGGQATAAGMFGQATGSLLDSAMWYGNRQGWFAPSKNNSMPYVPAK